MWLDSASMTIPRSQGISRTSRVSGVISSFTRAGRSRNSSHTSCLLGFLFTWKISYKGHRESQMGCAIQFTEGFSAGQQCMLPLTQEVPSPLFVPNQAEAEDSFSLLLILQKVCDIRVWA